jgi:ABC-type multidrug transport system fused ATPase/permease subunit
LAWIYLLGGGQLQSGAIGLGTFVAFVLYQGRLYGPAAGLLGLVKTLQQANVSIERVAEILGEEESFERTDHRKTDTEAAICLENVSFAYADGVPVLVVWPTRGSGRKLQYWHLGRRKIHLVHPFGLRKPHSGTVSIRHDHWDMLLQSLSCCMPVSARTCATATPIALPKPWLKLPDWQRPPNSSCHCRKDLTP